MIYELSSKGEGEEAVMTSTYVSKEKRAVKQEREGKTWSWKAYTNDQKRGRGKHQCERTKRVNVRKVRRVMTKRRRGGEGR